MYMIYSYELEHRKAVHVKERIASIMAQPQITLYTQEQFEGTPATYTTSQLDLGDFSYKILSISTSDPDDEHKQWILYTDPHYKGLCWMPENGQKYGTIPLSPVESIRLVDMRTL
jgi:hypothetical protein